MFRKSQYISINNIYANPSNFFYNHEAPAWLWEVLG